MVPLLVSHWGDNSFSLETIGYKNIFDNQLKIRISLKTLKGTFSTEKLVLLIQEVEDLIRWCRLGYELKPLIQFLDLYFLMRDAGDDLLPLEIGLQKSLQPPCLDTTVCNPEGMEGVRLSSGRKLIFIS